MLNLSTSLAAQIHHWTDIWHTSLERPNMDPRLIHKFTPTYSTLCTQQQYFTIHYSTPESNPNSAYKLSCPCHTPRAIHTTVPYEDTAPYRKPCLA